MNALYTAEISTAFGTKSISVIAMNILDVDEEIDILTTSAFLRSYAPTPKTMFAALSCAGISVQDLSADPEIDLRELCNVWLSKEITGAGIKRIGCVEMSRYTPDRSGIYGNEQAILNAIKAYFQMLDVAATGGIRMKTVALPLLGAGRQEISGNLTLLPILNECVDFLKRNGAVERILFIDINQSNAFRLAQVMSRSYSMICEAESTAKTQATAPASGGASAFISYTTADRNVADNLCAKLEARGVKVWYAPRNVHNAYASDIARAIKESTHFIVILSENSMRSEHVLNEIDLAFKGLPNRIKFKPLRIDTAEFAPAFDYYLSRQHWLDAHVPPLEKRLEEYVNAFMEDL
ncbi:MAG: toll/interleukin-1 receptor domain-containing protein [Ruminococcaceae bacterium]|nr:toll/interleukin-1 receptor domain-containing protein [Oscillospiraceae bacterium]